MARHRRSKKQDDCQSRRDGVDRSVRFIGLSAAAGTFITFSLSPLVHMPVAKADGEDIIIDQIINSLSAVDPTAALDMSSWLSSLDAALQGAANFDPSSLAGAADLDPSTPSALIRVPASDRRSALSAAATSADPAAPIRRPIPPRHRLPICTRPYIYDPAQTWHQDWIAGTTFLGNLTVQWDNALNGFWGDIGGQGMLIGNGADGIDGGTLAEANGGAGGLWFGDGGDGWNRSCPVQGGAGGIAYDGNGGAGGEGYDGKSGRRRWRHRLRHRR